MTFSLLMWKEVFIACFVVALLWILAIIACNIGQYIWAWIDDDLKTSRRNWLVHKLNFSKWKYPIYLNPEEKAFNKIFAYSKHKDDEGKCLHGVKYGDEARNSHGVNYIYTHDVGFGHIVHTILATSALPMVILIIMEFWVSALVISLAVGTAFLARSSRRLLKKFNLHKNDKKVHLSVDS